MLTYTQQAQVALVTCTLANWPAVALKGNDSICPAALMVTGVGVPGVIVGPTTLLASQRVTLVLPVAPF